MDASPLAARLRHDHAHGAPRGAHEARTRWVVVLTFVMMVGELVVGYRTGSLALTADGWHMATHAGALGMAALAYWFARTRSRDATFSFGTGKVHALAGYTSAVVLAVIALWMMAEAASRLVHPVAIAFGDALPVAVLGLVVNLASVKLLDVPQGHGHHHGDRDGAARDEDHHHDRAGDHDGHGHGHHHQDHNLRAAYLHVLADAFTSVLAILALLGGRYAGWRFLDPAMGLVGGVVISRWSFTLCRGAARQLLDVVPSEALAARIRRHLEEIPGTEIVDLHVWEIGPKARACLASVVSPGGRSPLEYSEVLRAREELAHVTVEVHSSVT